MVEPFGKRQAQRGSATSVSGRESVADTVRAVSEAMAATLPDQCANAASPAPDGAASE